MYNPGPRYGSQRPEPLRLAPSHPKPVCFLLSQQQPGCTEAEPPSAKKPQASVSPLPRVLQSQPCSTRNQRHVGNAADKPSALPAILLSPAAMANVPTAQDNVPAGGLQVTLPAEH